MQEEISQESKKVFHKFPRIVENFPRFRARKRRKAPACGKVPENMGIFSKFPVADFRAVVYNGTNSS